jgi:hypothetical protein
MATRQIPHISGALATLWHSLRRDLFDTYRPERHYMRGPGPAWRAKHPVEAAALKDLARASI